LPRYSNLRTNVHRSRPFSGNLYTSDALQLLQQLFSAIQTSKKELPIAVETELLSLVEHALTLEETKTNEKLVLTLIELLVKFQEFQRYVLSDIN
jgi:hypothetical protein